MANVRKTKTKSGEARYVVTYRGSDGKQREEWFRTSKQANARRVTLEAELLRGVWVDPRRAMTTFETFARQWLELDPTKRPKTRACDESTLDVHLIPALGPRKLGAITPTDVRALVATWSAKAAPSTVRRRYAVLRAISPRPSRRTTSAGRRVAASSSLASSRAGARSSRRRSSSPSPTPSDRSTA